MQSSVRLCAVKIDSVRQCAVICATVCGETKFCATDVTIRCDRSSDAIKNLGWEKLETIRKRNKATLVFKCQNNLAPACFKNYFTRNSSYHFYNTRQKQDLHILKAKLSKGKKTFRFSGATLFNRLPDSLKQAKSLQIFKRNIGHYSF